MIVKLTKKLDNKIVHVNASHLVLWDEAADGVGSRVVFDSDWAYEVVETPQEVHLLLCKCYGVRAKAK